MQPEVSSNTQVEIESIDNSIQPLLFRLRTQLLSQGRSQYTLASTDLLSIKIKCYAEGGENALHTHPAEDHTFIVLAGKAKFFGKDGEIGVLAKNQGILVPQGFYYKYESCGDEPLVVLRLGAEKEKLEASRVGLDGNSFPGKSKENNYSKGIPIEGLYYE